MAVTLCIPPRAGELCAPVRFLLRADSVVMELTARHRITGVEWDVTEQALAMAVEITDPETARPVDVRIDVVATGAPCPDPRTQKIGTIVRDGQEHDVVGTLSRRRRRRKLKPCMIGEALSTKKRTAAIVGVYNTRQGRRLDGETS